MPRRSKRPKIVLTAEDMAGLRKLVATRAEEHRKVVRGRIILLNQEGDRKSVVQGKSVELGGSRSIKKKIKTQK